PGLALPSLPAPMVPDVKKKIRDLILAGRKQEADALFAKTRPTAGPKPEAKLSPSPLWVRAVRAAIVLEHIATPEARQLLQTLAKGEAEALPTKEAKAALDRFKNILSKE